MINLVLQPTSLFVHDSEVQTVIADIISKKIDPTTDGFTFTLDQLKQAFDIYNADMLKVDKEYTPQISLSPML